MILIKIIMDEISRSNGKVDSNFEGRTALEKLSRPKIWAAATVTAGLASIVTAAVAFTIPAAAAACTIAAVAVLLGTTSLIRHCIAKKQPANGYDLALELVGKVTDPNQIAILRQFNPDAQIFIRYENLFDEKTENCEWMRNELQFFRPEEIQPLLNHFGQKFSLLDFSACGYLLETIDLSCCSELTRLYLDGQSRLQTISGLASCSRLWSISLLGCTGLDEDSVIGELTRLKCVGRFALYIVLTGSSLVIRGQDALLEKFAPNGKWKRFLETHPGAWLVDLLKDAPNQGQSLIKALESLGNCGRSHWAVEEGGGNSSYSIGKEVARRFVIDLGLLAKSSRNAVS